jgi:dihydroflavonol-4-reductase
VSFVAVTGATGHVGGCLLRQLLAEGQQVRALVRTPAQADAIAGLDVERIVGDVRDAAAMRKFVEGADIVYHLAAVISIVGPRGGLVDAVNVRGVRNVAQAALDASVRRFVHVCSVHAFDQAPLDQPLDESRARVQPGRAPAYDVSKAGGEAEVRRLVEEGLDAVIVHPAGIVGPYDYAPSRMGHVFLDIYHRRLPALVAGGFNWVDVRDVCQGIRAAAERGRTNESYMLSGHYHPIAEVAAVASEVTGVAAPRLMSPMWLARVGAPVMEAWAKLTRTEPLYTSESLTALRANENFVNEKARRELTFSPRPFADSVRDAYAWFAAAGRLTAPPAKLQPDHHGEISVF